jgi:GT2 family glycosyltransferase
LSVAVLVVNYHVDTELDRLLSSIAPFLRAGDEVVVVDQESEPARLARLRAAHPRVTFVPTDRNIGFAAGVNRAARASTAPLLLLVNPDAVVDEPVIEQLEQYLDAHPHVGVVGPRVLNEDGTVQPSARRFPGLSTLFAGRSTWLSRRFPGNPLSQWNLPAQRSGAPVAVDWLAGSCLMVRRRVFDDLQGLDEAFFLYWEDADFCRRAAALGWARMYVPTVSVRHAGGRSAATNPAPAVRAFHASAYRLFEKHAGRGARLLAPLARLGLWLRGEWFARKSERGFRRTRGTA